jgi:hypothetical protein
LVREARGPADRHAGFQSHLKRGSNLEIGFILEAHGFAAEGGREGLEGCSWLRTEVIKKIIAVQIRRNTLTKRQNYVFATDEHGWGKTEFYDLFQILIRVYQCLSVANIVLGGCEKGYYWNSTQRMERAW